MTASHPAALLVIAVALVACAPTSPQATLPAPSASQSSASPSSASQSSGPRGPVVTPVTTADLGASWRPGCPVGPQDLRRVELDFLGFDGRVQRGAMVVHRDLVDDVIAIFGDLMRQRYPVAQMRTVEHYPNAEDEASMRDNNTSAFNCRPLPNSSEWSLHAYGRAVDVNPLINPYIDKAGDLEPATAGPFLDRTRDEPGMLRAGSPAVATFTDRGWRWGGAWRDPIDYQHFEKR